MAATKNIFLSSVLQAVMLGLYVQVHEQHESERCYTVTGILFAWDDKRKTNCESNWSWRPFRTRN